MAMAPSAASPPPAPTSAVPASPSMPTQRPTGVTILAVLAAIGAVLMLFAGLGALAIGGMGAAADAGVFAAIAGVLGVFLLVLGAIDAAAAYGLWTRKRWGWFLAAIAAGLGALSAIFQLFSGEFFGSLIGLAINGFLLWYLLSPVIQRWFGVSYNTPWKYKETMS